MKKEINYTALHNELSQGTVITIEKHPKSNIKVMITAKVKGENLQAMSVSLEDCLVQITEFIQEFRLEN